MNYGALERRSICEHPPAIVASRQILTECLPCLNRKGCFFAIELPDATRQEVVRWRAEHFPQDAGRPVAAANLHLTLAFFGGSERGKNNGRWKRWPVAFVSQALRYNSMMPGNGCVRASSGLAVASRHAGCCNWRICCALRLHAADAGKAQHRFILISPCYAMPVMLSRYRRRFFTGLFL